MKIREGNKLPDAKVFILENEPKVVSIKQIIESEKVIIFGLPGAFTPTCSAKHLPGFLNSTEEIKKKNVKKVICVSVNDPFVMGAWAKLHKVEGKIIMLADNNCDFTKSIGAEIDLSRRGLGIRSKRYTILVDKGIVKKISQEESPGKCEITAAENFLKVI